MERIQPEHMENPVNQEELGVKLIQEREMPAEAKKATLVSAIDGSPFTAIFDSESRRMLMYDMNGESMGIREVQDEAEFRKLVEINANLTRQNNETTERINRNVSVIDVETKTITEYDCNGHGIATPLENLNPEMQANYQGSRAYSQTVSQHNAALSNSASASITPMSFDTGSVFMQVPYATSPNNGPLVGGSFLYTTSSTTTVELWTYNFPSGMSSIDVRFINAIGDDFSTFFFVPAMHEIRHTVKYKGEAYGARVTTYSGTFNNVQLRYFANGGGTGGGGLTIPTVVTYYPSSITSGGATLEGNITLNGGATITEYGFYIWSGSSPTTLLPIYQNTNGGFFNWVRTGLSPDTLYFVQAYAKNSMGTAVGSVQSFWTLSNVTIPTVITNNPSINGANVTFNGNITMNGGAVITEYGFDFWPSGGSTIRRTYYQSTYGGTYVWGENLSPNTMYYVRAFARNSAGYAYGTTISFWTQNVLSVPTVLTNAVTNILSSQATFNGNITANGGSLVTEFGFYYWPVGSSSTKILVGYNTYGGTYNWTPTLSPGTQYYVQAYAINSTGTGYGSPLLFTTQGVPSDTVIKPLPQLTGDYRTDIVAIARSQIGVKEEGSSDTDRNPFSREVTGSDGHDWCGDFVAWVIKRAGLASYVVHNWNTLPENATLDSGWNVSYSYNWDREATNKWVRGYATPKVGDIAVWGGHVAIVTSVSGGNITFVGGNQSNQVSEQNATSNTPKWGTKAFLGYTRLNPLL